MSSSPSRSSILAVKLQGGFGNHLLAYFAAVILARDLPGAKIQLLTNELPNDTNALRQDTRSVLRKIVHPNWIATENELSIWQQHPYTAVLNDVPSYYAFAKDGWTASEAHYIHLTLITIYLADYEYHRILLRNSIQLPSPLCIPISQIQEKDIVLSFRLGMGSAEVSPTVFSASGQHRLPFAYYEQALADILASRTHENGRLIVCSDNFQDAYIRQLCDQYASLFPSGIVLGQWDTWTQFSCILQAHTLVSSNSTFSVMGAILSDAHTIYVPSVAPYGTLYRVDTRTDPDLFRILDSSRFKPISLP